MRASAICSYCEIWKTRSSNIGLEVRSEKQLNCIKMSVKDIDVNFFPTVLLFYKLVFRLRNIPFLTWVSKLHRAGVEGRNFPIFKSEGRPLIPYPEDPGQCLCDAITGQH